MDFTHKQLCELSVNWLKRPASRGGPGCQVAFSESRGDWNGETPDAIGFRAGVHNESSVVVEVKISRADFFADQKKPHRADPASGMGVYRYYMTPEGLIKPDELPPRWGLVEVTAKGVLKARSGHVLLKYQEEDVWQHERAISGEWTLLARMLSRVGDVEKAQNWLKESRNLNARLARSNDDLRAKNDELSRQLFLARNPDLESTPLVATRRQSEQAA